MPHDLTTERRPVSQVKTNNTDATPQSDTSHESSLTPLSLEREAMRIIREMVAMDDDWKTVGPFECPADLYARKAAVLAAARRLVAEG